MSTKLIHLTYEGNFLLDHTASVIACSEDEELKGDFHVVLNETVFHPQVSTHANNLSIQ